MLSSQIELEQLHEVSASPFISLMTDESTDVAVLKELVLYARYLSPDGKAKSTYLSIQDLFNGTAETIYEAITKYCASNDISLSKCMGFGSDGASVMTGVRTGVSTRLKSDNCYLVSIHCVAHRLQLKQVIKFLIYER